MVEGARGGGPEHKTFKYSRRKETRGVLEIHEEINEGIKEGIDEELGRTTGGTILGEVVEGTYKTGRRSRGIHEKRSISMASTINELDQEFRARKKGEVQVSTSHFRCTPQ